VISLSLLLLQRRRITSTGRFVPEIDGLRFVATTSVVAYHYWQGFVAINTMAPEGWWGSSFLWGSLNYCSGMLQWQERFFTPAFGNNRNYFDASLRSPASCVLIF